jgi:predicted Rossmann-fold nucleotide-binding protein
VQSADAVIVVGGSYGTLSEIALSLKAGREVFGLASW